MRTQNGVVTVSAPAAAHTSSMPVGDGTAPDTSDGCTKIDATMIVPITIAVARVRPMACRSPRGGGRHYMKSACTSPADYETKRLHGLFPITRARSVRAPDGMRDARLAEPVHSSRLILPKWHVDCIVLPGRIPDPLPPETQERSSRK